MGEALDQLLAYRNTEDCYAVSFEEIRDLQITAMNERLQERIDRIKLLNFRANKAGISTIREFSDVVPLLLPHTAYKSYPESYLFEEKWDKLTRWLGTVSTYPINEIDFNGITDIDDWIARLEDAGHPVACSSGTTGKASILISSEADLKEQGDDMVRAIAWGTGIRPVEDRHVFNIGPRPPGKRIRSIAERIAQAFGKADAPVFHYPAPAVTVGAITKMVILRKAIAEGTAMPEDIADFERTNAAREKAFADAIDTTVNSILLARGEKLYISGLWGNVYEVAAAIRQRGFTGKDFHPENMLFVAGGLKLAKLPPDYREFICETFNIQAEHNFLFYGMQEINAQIPRCGKGNRYHLPPWAVCLPLDRDGEQLLPMEGVVEGRAAVFDLSMDGRWGGVISGDKIEIDFNPCQCGARSPSIRDNITRYKDLDGDDKISCSGSVDAYVRGLS